MRLRGGLRQEEDVIGAAPDNGAYPLHHLLQHRHQVLLDVLAGRRDPEHLQLDMEAMFDIVW